MVFTPALVRRNSAGIRTLELDVLDTLAVLSGRDTLADWNPFGQLELSREWKA